MSTQPNPPDHAPPARSEAAPGDDGIKRPVRWRVYGDQCFEVYSTIDNGFVAECLSAQDAEDICIALTACAVSDAKDWEAVINDKPEAINAAIELAERWLSYNDFPTADTQTHITIICQALMFLADDAKFTTSVAVADADRFAGGRWGNYDSISDHISFNELYYCQNVEQFAELGENIHEWSDDDREENRIWVDANGYPEPVKFPPAGPAGGEGE